MLMFKPKRGYVMLMFTLMFKSKRGYVMYNIQVN